MKTTMNMKDLATSIPCKLCPYILLCAACRDRQLALCVAIQAWKRLSYQHPNIDAKSINQWAGFWIQCGSPDYPTTHCQMKWVTDAIPSKSCKTATRPLIKKMKTCRRYTHAWWYQPDPQANENENEWHTLIPVKQQNVKPGISPNS